ncbi:unnamed protein product, partial [Prorocentrum cordatum]
RRRRLGSRGAAPARPPPCRGRRSRPATARRRATPRAGAGRRGTESGASEGKEYYQVRNTFVEAIESSCSHAGCGSGKACCSHAAQRPCGSEPPPAIGERGSRRREPLMRLARTPSRPCWPGPRAASDSSPDPPPRRG